jgi:hypothetical protein
MRKAFVFMVVFWGLAIGLQSGWAQGTVGKQVTITTRTAGEYSVDLNANTQGPAPGDVAMEILLQDNGISTRVVPDKLFYDITGGADVWLKADTGEEVPVNLVIFSGSGGSSDVPDVNPIFEKKIPMLMGEHVCLAQEAKPGSIKMYKGAAEGHKDFRDNAIRKIKIVNKDHPITKGIPTDADGFVQVFRDPFPNEGLFTKWLDKGSFVADGLYENRVALGSVANKADGTVILAEIDLADDIRVCLAVVDQGGVLADGTKSPCRLVHWITNEEGSGGPRRDFMALNKTGRELFVRAVRWALGMEPGTPVVDFFEY